MNAWKKYWENYRREPIKKEEDLFFQVGKTINKKPVNAELFDGMISDISEALNLSGEDVLVELCCGNGLLTKELSKIVKHIYAFDFTEHLIKVAEEHKSSDNISYSINDAKRNFSKSFAGKGATKFLMNDSLGYFSPEELENILLVLKKESEEACSFYVTGIPSDELKYNFYDTEERKENFLKNENTFNDGIGKWWSREEIAEAANRVGVLHKIKKQKTSNFRVDTLFLL